ncbi:MAG: type IX secretion system PorP/SprF family membrane protein [Arenicella sp.]|jgi:type IX secretion system PorP/SprF family membrane protein
MKKIYLLLVVVISISGSLQAQQDPHFVSEGFSPFWTNPASFGSWNKFSVNTVGGLEYVGFGDPRQKLMVNAEFALPIGEKFTPNSTFQIGTGINFIATSFGGIKTKIFQVPLNYQFKIQNTTLSIGVSPGFRQLDFTYVIWVPPTDNPDPLIPIWRQSTFQLDAGVFWYGEQFYLGLSSTQITTPIYDELYFQSARHYYLQGGYRFKVGKHYIFPQLQLGFDGATFGFWNLNYFQFKEDIFSVGIGVRAGWNVLFAATARYKQFKIAYNYDLISTPFGGFSKGSHQVRLSFIIDKAGKNKGN